MTGKKTIQRETTRFDNTRNRNNKQMNIYQLSTNQLQSHVLHVKVNAWPRVIGHVNELDSCISNILKTTSQPNGRSPVVFIQMYIKHTLGEPLKGNLPLNIII